MSKDLEFNEPETCVGKRCIVEDKESGNLIEVTCVDFYTDKPSRPKRVRYKSKYVEVVYMPGEYIFKEFVDYK